MIRLAAGFKRDESGLEIGMELPAVVPESGPVGEFRRTELHRT